jgi:hypothetical protein
MSKNKNIFKAVTTLGLGLCAVAVLSLGVMIPSSVANAMTGNQTPIDSGINGTLPSWDNVQGSNSSTLSSVMSSESNLYSSTISSVMSSSDYSTTKSNGGGQSSSYSTTSMSSSSQTSSNPSKIDAVISVIQKSVDTPVKVLDKAPGKDLGKDESLIILRERRSKTIRNVTVKYLVLSSDQMATLNKKLPDMNQMLQEASGSTNLTISINCNVSYPPFRIKCTIDIAW